jgi:hypothetical protein
VETIINLAANGVPHKVFVKLLCDGLEEQVNCLMDGTPCSTYGVRCPKLEASWQHAWGTKYPVKPRQEDTDNGGKNI